MHQRALTYTIITVILICLFVVSLVLSPELAKFVSYALGIIGLLLFASGLGIAIYSIFRLIEDQKEEKWNKKKKNE